MDYQVYDKQYRGNRESTFNQSDRRPILAENRTSTTMVLRDGSTVRMRGPGRIDVCREFSNVPVTFQAVLTFGRETHSVVVMYQEDRNKYHHAGGGFIDFERRGEYRETQGRSYRPVRYTKNGRRHNYRIELVVGADGFVKIRPAKYTANNAQFIQLTCQTPNISELYTTLDEICLSNSEEFFDVLRNIVFFWQRQC